MNNYGNKVDEILLSNKNRSSNLCLYKNTNIFEMERHTQPNIVLYPEKAKDSLFEAIVEYMKSDDPISFYYLRSKVSKYLSWCLKEGKNKE